MFCQSFGGKCIKFTGCCVRCDLCIPGIAVELGEPLSKLRKLVR